MLTRKAGNYQPPPCKFNQVVITLTARAKGQQDDQLAIMYMGDVEVFRSYTAQPTPSGIRWTYQKDVSHYFSLFRSPQKIIFDLGNEIEGKFTAPYEVKLTATFLNRPTSKPAASLILPISKRLSGSSAGSGYSIPKEKALSSVKFPRNVQRAVVSLAATGQGTEELWYTNILSSDKKRFPANNANIQVYSSFREVQLFINGSLAGVVWPQPVIPPGGFSPLLWNPVVGIDAFDLREGEIDITPWLPLLCDGKESHDFEIRVVGVDDDSNGNARLSKTVGNSWLVSGKIFVWLDAPNSVTTGTRKEYSVPEAKISLESTSKGERITREAEDISYSLSARRQLRIRSSIKTSRGERDVFWTQSLDTRISVGIGGDGESRTSRHDTKGKDESSSGYKSQYQFPLSIEVAIEPDNKGNGAEVQGVISRKLNVQTWGPSVSPTGLEPFAAVPEVKDQVSKSTGTTLDNSQEGRFSYVQTRGNVITNSESSTEQTLTFGGLGDRGRSDMSRQTPLYRRHVRAKNGRLTQDEEVYDGQRARDQLGPLPQSPSFRSTAGTKDWLDSLALPPDLRPSAGFREALGPLPQSPQFRSTTSDVQGPFGSLPQAPDFVSTARGAGSLPRSPNFRFTPDRSGNRPLEFSDVPWSWSEV